MFGHITRRGRHADAVQPASVRFDVLLVSFLCVSLFRSCPFKSSNERRGIAAPVGLGSLESMPSHAGLMYGCGDTLGKFFSLSA